MPSANHPLGNYDKAFRRMSEQIGRLAAGLAATSDGSDGGNIARCKRVVETFREFYAKWRPGMRDEKDAAMLDQMQAGKMAVLARSVERMSLTYLAEVIEAYENRWRGEKLFKAAVAYIQMRELAPPELRPMLEEAHRTHVKKDYELTSYFRQAEADAAEADARAKRALAEFKAACPERVDAELCERLETWDGEALARWRIEVQAEAAVEG